MLAYVTEGGAGPDPRDGPGPLLLAQPRRTLEEGRLQRPHAGNRGGPRRLRRRRAPLPGRPDRRRLPHRLRVLFLSHRRRRDRRRARLRPGRGVRVGRWRTRSPASNARTRTGRSRTNRSKRSAREGLRNLREAVADLREILTAYEDRAVRDEDFAAFIEFQDRIGHFTNDLPEVLPERETFEEIDDLLQQRRLVESDFERARERLNEAEAALDPLEDWEDATDRYREARRAVGRRLDEVRDEIADRERLQRLGEADLDAPVERLRDPIEAYDATVSEAFRSFVADSSAREVLDFLATTAHFPLVPFERPPDDLRAFVRTSEAGGESIPQLLEYAGFSRSKLDHYVDDPDALKRAVATQQTYLERLDADPLTVGWPPPEADAMAALAVPGTHLRGGTIRAGGGSGPASGPRTHPARGLRPAPGQRAGPRPVDRRGT